MTSISTELEITDMGTLLTLSGPQNEKLRALEREADVQVGLRGNTIFIRGEPEAVALAERFLAESVSLLGSRGIRVETVDMRRALRMLRDDPERHLADMFAM